MFEDKIKKQQEGGIVTDYDDGYLKAYQECQAEVEEKKISYLDEWNDDVEYTGYVIIKTFEELFGETK